MKLPTKKFRVSYATKDVGDKEWQHLAGAAYIIETTTPANARKEARKELLNRFGEFGIPWKITAITDYVTGEFYL